MGRAYEIVIRIVGEDKASGPIGKSSNALQRMGEIAGGIIIAGTLQAIGRGIASIAKEALTAAGDFQALTISFETLLAREIVASGVTDDYADALSHAVIPAKELLNWVKEIAVTTPFTVQGLARTTQLGMAMGFASEETKEMTMAIGNFTAGMGLGDEVMERIIYNFGQMRQQGKVTGTELRDLARGAFVPVTDVLKQMQVNMGLTEMSFADFREEARSGKLDVTEFFTAFISIAETQFPGAMDRMARTWQGVTNNAKDFVQAVLGAEVLGPVVDNVTQILADLLEKGMSPELRETAQSIGSALGGSFEFIAGRVRDYLLPAITDFIEMLGVKLPGEGKSAREIILDIALSIGEFIVKIGEVIGKITTWISENKDLANSIATFIAAFIAAKIVIAIVLGIVGIIAALVGSIIAIPVLIGLLIAGIVTLFMAWKNNWGGIQDKTKAVIDNIKAWFQGLVDTWKQNWENIKIIFETVWLRITEGLASLADFFLDIWTKIGLIVQLAIDTIWKVIIEPMILWFISTFMPTIVLIGSVFQAVFNLILSIIELFGAVFTLIMTAVQGFWENILLPAIQKGIVIFQMVAAIVGIVLKDAFDTVLGVIAGVVAFWKAALTPVFTTFKNIAEGVAKTVGGVLKGAFTILKGILNTVWGVIKAGAAILKGVFTSAVNKVVNLIKGTLVNAIEKGKAKFDAIKGAVQAVIGIIQSLIRKIKEFTDKIKNIKLPKWLTPGSPTPFEMGLRGIDDAMKGVNRSMIVSPLVGGASGAFGGGGGGARISNVEINVSGAGDPEAVANVILRKLKQQGVFS